MSVIAFKEKSRVLVEQYSWPLSTAKGYVDGETFRKRRREPPIHALVGIDDYSEGFRAGYYRRPVSEEALSGAPSNQPAEKSFPALARRSLDFRGATERLAPPVLLPSRR